MIKINEILNKFEKYLRDRLDDYQTLYLDQDLVFEDVLTEQFLKDLKNEYFELRID